MGRKSLFFKVIIAIVVLGLFTASLALADEEKVAGTLIKTKEGIVLKAINGNRLAVTGKDVSTLVGKSVLATGIVVEDVTGFVINILRIEVIEDAP